MRKIFILQSVDVEINERKICLLGLEAAWIGTFFFLRVDEGFSLSLLFPPWGSCFDRELSRRLVILSIFICRDLRHGQILNQRSGQRCPTSRSRERRVVFKLTSLLHQKTCQVSWFPHRRWHEDQLKRQVCVLLENSRFALHQATSCCPKPQFTVMTSVDKYISTSQK